MAHKETGLAGGSLQAQGDDQLSGSISSSNNPSANANQGQVYQLYPEAIIVPESHRAVDPAVVDSLAESMKRVGLLCPILVRASKDENAPAVLIAGRHRLEAAKKLGWSSIDGYCLYVSEAEARMREITENLHRSDLTKLERAEQIEEWRVLCEEQAKVAQVVPLGGKQKKQRGQRKAAKELGVTHTEVQRAEKIAKITPAAKKAAKDAGIDDNQSKLLKVAAADPEKQTATVHKLADAADEARRDKAGRKAWLKATKPERDARKKKEAERRKALDIEIERLASKLIELDRDTARRLWDLLDNDPTGGTRLMYALARALGLDDDGDDGSASS